MNTGLGHLLLLKSTHHNIKPMSELYFNSVYICSPAILLGTAVQICSNVNILTASYTAATQCI